ncbi:hypothetical protein FPV67DRAFT_1750631 [Lyophyllum atratum]|nr:hypothetical protein FPV67DRAFT_1750631 [Lyophyllum atratum]
MPHAARLYVLQSPPTTSTVASTFPEFSEERFMEFDWGAEEVYSNHDRLKRLCVYCPTASPSITSSRLQGLPPPPTLQDAMDRAELLPHRLLELEEELRTHNKNGDLVTYDRTLKGWVTWERPIVKFKNGTMKAVAPSGWLRIENFEPPLCPHAANGFRTDDEAKMDLQQRRVKGATVYFFKSKSHPCRFISRIRPQVSVRRYILHGTTDARHSEELSDTDVSDREHHDYGFDPSLSSSQTSQASLASSKSASEVAAYLRDTSPPTPPYKVSFTGPRPLKSFFSQEVADMRSSSDEKFIAWLYKSHQRGDFDDISAHPAAQGKVPKQLAPYDPSSTSTRTSQHLQYFDTAIGYALRELNSTAGITENAFTILSEQAHLCKGCNCLFSGDGYDAHLDEESRCKNTPEFRSVQRYPSGAGAVPPIPIRTYPYNTPIPGKSEFHETHIGKALLEWNSPIGVPKDVWALAMTSCVYCQTCKLIRTFDGDRGHRNGADDCLDIGERGAVIVPARVPRTEPLAMVMWKTQGSSSSS